MTEPFSHGFLQLRDDADGRKDRVLRSGSLRENDEPSRDLWAHGATSRGEMVCLETETDRTLFFDLLPLDVGVIGGFKTRLQLYTVPGQGFYNTTRKLVLKGVDGIVFV